MQIRKSTATDIPPIMQIYSDAKAYMIQTGNRNQWVGTYPQKTILQDDIAAGNSYVCTEDSRVLCTFFFSIGDDPAYATIHNGAWLNDDPYDVIHRIAVAQHERGVATYCINWALSQCGNLRIDTHEDNKPMRALLAKLGFTQCGIIYQDNTSQRIAFQKKITDL